MENLKEASEIVTVFYKMNESGKQLHEVLPEIQKMIDGYKKGQESNSGRSVIGMPTETEMYAELDRQFNLKGEDRLPLDDTQIGWEECYKWIKKFTT